MDVHVVDLSEMVLAGFRGFIVPGKVISVMSEWPERDQLWAKLLSFLTSNSGEIPGNVITSAAYEVRTGDVLHANSEGYELFVGYEVGSEKGLPNELVVINVPAGLYAKFSVPTKRIDSEWERGVVDSWLSSSGYQRLGSYIIHVYKEVEGWLDVAPRSGVDLLIPLEPERGTPHLAI